MTLVPSARIPAEQWTSAGASFDDDAPPRSHGDPRALRRAGTPGPRRRRPVGPPSGRSDRLRVLRVSKSGVVTRLAGARAAAPGHGRRPDPGDRRPLGGGGSMVAFSADGDEFVVPSGPSAATRTSSSSTRWPCGGRWVRRMGPHRHARGAVRSGGGRGAGPVPPAVPTHPVRGLIGPEHRQAVSATVPVVRAVEPAEGGRAPTPAMRRRVDPTPEGSPSRVRAPAVRSRCGAVRPGGHPPPSERLRVGFVGRLIPHKGVDVLIEAVAGDDRMSVELFGAGPESVRLAARQPDSGSTTG